MSNNELGENNYISTTSQLLLRVVQSSKVMSISENYPYVELQHFRQQLQGPTILPYDEQKKVTRFYQVVFVCLGIIFSLLTALVWYNRATWFSNVLFNDAFLLKWILCGLCFLFSLTSLGFAYSLKPEKEVVQRLIRKAHRKISHVHAHKVIHFGFRRFLVFCSDHRQSQLIRHAYRETLDRIHDLKESTLGLLSHISTSNNLSADHKTRLYNLALLELRDQLNKIVHSFKKSTD